MKLPSFFSSKKTATAATAAELAGKVMEAEDANRVAEKRVAETRAALASERTEAALQAHRTAQTEAADIAVMLEIVRGDHADAVAREQAAARALLEAKLEELKRETSLQSVLDAARAEAATEARLLLELAQCRIRRCDMRTRFKRIEGERDNLAHSLGHDVPAPNFQSDTAADAAVSPRAVVDLLRPKAVTGTPLAGFLADLKPNHRSYLPAVNRFE